MSIQEVRLLVPNIPPFATWTGDRDCNDCVGLFCDLVSHVYKSLAKKYKIKMVIAPLAGGVGEEVSPGNWTGILGILQRKEADVMGSMFMMIPEMYNIIDYPTAYTALTFSVLSGPPAKLNQESTSSVFSAFTYQFWIVLILSCTCISCIYRWMAALDLKINAPCMKEEISLVESIITFYGLIVQRGFDKLPLTLNRRLVVAGWLLAVSVLTGVIGGTFSAMLAVKGKPDRIDRVRDILRYPFLRPYIALGSGVDVFLQLSPLTENRLVWEQAVRYNSTVEVEKLFSKEFMDDVSAGNAVALACVEGVIDITVNKQCSEQVRPFYVSKESFWSSPVSILHRKDLSPQVAEDCNLLITNFGGMGMQSSMWKEHKKMTQRCYDFAFSKTSYASLTLRDMRQVFEILGLGSVLGVLTLAFEIAATRIRLKMYKEQ